MSTATAAVQVFFAGLLTAVATGLGALPFLFVKDVSDRWMGIASALAAGFMLGASVGLVQEGTHSSTVAALGGLALGYVSISLGMRLLDRLGADDGHGHGHGHVGAEEVAETLEDAVSTPERGWLTVGMRLVLVMTIHSFSEGIGVGVAWGSGAEFGLLVALAIAVHNIPEGLAISVVLVSRGESVGRAAWMSIVSSLPQPVMAVPAYLFVEQFSTLLPWGLGFAAGAMVWMTLTDLVPDARKNAGTPRAVIALLLAAVAMIAFQEIFVLN